MVEPFIIPPSPRSAKNAKAVAKRIFGEGMVRDKGEIARIVREAGIVIPKPSLPPLDVLFNGTETITSSQNIDRVFHGKSISPDTDERLPDTEETIAVFVNQRGLYNPKVHGRYRLPARLNTSLKKVFERTHAAMRATGRFYVGLHEEMSPLQLKNSKKRKKAATSLLRKIDEQKLRSILLEHHDAVPFYIFNKINGLVEGVEEVRKKNLRDLHAFPSHAELKAEYADVVKHNARLEKEYTERKEACERRIEQDPDGEEVHLLYVMGQRRKAQRLTAAIHRRHKARLSHWCVVNRYVPHLSWAKFITRRRSENGKVNVWKTHLFDNCATFSNYVDKRLHVRHYDGKMHRRSFQKFLPILEEETASAINSLLSDYPDMDVYTSEGTFRAGAYQRTEDNLASLPNLFLDLDLKDTPFHRPEADEDTRKVLAESAVTVVINRCRKLSLPIPSSIVWSGNGIHLRWNFKEALRRCDKTGRWTRLKYVDEDGRTRGMSGLDAFNEMQRVLCGFFRDMGADINALDPVRVLRPVGTVNRKNGCPVVSLWPRLSAEDKYGYVSYDAKELSKYLIGCPVKERNDLLMWCFVSNLVAAGHIKPRTAVEKAPAVTEKAAVSKTDGHAASSRLRDLDDEYYEEDEAFFRQYAQEEPSEAEILATHGRESFGMVADEDVELPSVSIPQVFEPFSSYERLENDTPDKEADPYPEDDLSNVLTASEMEILDARYMKYRSSYSGIPELRRGNTFKDNTDYMERFRSLMRCLSYMAKTENCTYYGESGVLGQGKRNSFAFHSFILYVNARRDSKAWRKKGVDAFLNDCKDDVEKALVRAGIGRAWVEGCGIEHALNTLAEEPGKNRGAWENVRSQVETYWNKGFIADICGKTDYTKRVEREGAYQLRLAASPGSILIEGANDNSDEPRYQMLHRGRFPMLGYTVTVERIMDECKITNRIAFKAGSTTLFTDEIRQHHRRLWQNSDRYQTQMGKKALLKELGMEPKRRGSSDECLMNDNGVLEEVRESGKTLRSYRKKAFIKTKMIRMMREGRTEIIKMQAAIMGVTDTRVRQIYKLYRETGEVSADYEYAFRQIDKLDTFITLTKMGINPFLNVNGVDRESSALEHRSMNFREIQHRIFVYVLGELRNFHNDRKKGLEPPEYGTVIEIDGRIPLAA